VGAVGGSGVLALPKALVDSGWCGKCTLTSLQTMTATNLDTTIQKIKSIW